MKRAGFTLVEALIAIAILGIVGTLVVGGFNQTFKNKNRVEADIDRYHVLRLALERMARELSMAYVSAQHNPNASLQVVQTGFIGEEHRIDFTSFSHQRLQRDSHESDQNELGYFLARHPDDPSVQVLARREQHRIDDDPTTGGNVMIMVENVEQFDLEYLDPTTGDWVRSWDSTQAAMQGNRLPSQVKLTLSVPHPRKRREMLVLGTRATVPLQFGLNHATYNP